MMPKPYEECVCIHFDLHYASTCLKGRNTLIMNNCHPYGIYDMVLCCLVLSAVYVAFPARTRCLPHVQIYHHHLKGNLVYTEGKFQPITF